MPKNVDDKKELVARLAAHNTQRYADHTDGLALLNSYVMKWGYNDKKMDQLTRHYPWALKLANRWCTRIERWQNSLVQELLDFGEFDK